MVRELTEETENSCVSPISLERVFSYGELSKPSDAESLFNSAFEI